MSDLIAQDLQRLNDGRILREAGLVLLPIITRMKEDVLARIIHASRSGESLIAAAAELTVLTELENKITRNNKETARREEKFNAEHGS